VFKTDVEFKGEVFNTEGASIDFADTQTESFPDPNSRQRKVEYAPLKKDIERRDFTVNMLLRDLTTGELKDLTGRSKKDIEKGILTIHPSVSDLTKPFREDPLRILRLVRFQVKYGWDIPLSVIRAVRSVSSKINNVSGERIQGELVKIAELGKLGRAMRIMRSVGILNHVFPEIERMRGVMHDTSRGHHQEGDVYKHTYLVLKNAKPTVLHQFTALLHDVGKPDTQEILADKIQFLGHENVGAEMAKAMLDRLRFDRATRDKIVRLVKNHMRPHHLQRNIDRIRENKNWSEDRKDKVVGGMVRKFIRKVGEDIVDTLLDQAEADVLGNLPPSNYVPKLRALVEEARNQPAEVKPLLNGREIMKLLDASPGPIIGEVSRFLLEQQDEDPRLTKKEAEELVLEEFGDA
jgi:poly(A) polymerase